MLHSPMMSTAPPSRSTLAGVALISESLLMIELALTRIFSVVMYYHFAFLAISIALFGLSASGVFAYIARRQLDRMATDMLLARQSVISAVCTIAALFVLVRLQVGLNYSPRNLALTLTIYARAAPQSGPHDRRGRRDHSLDPGRPAVGSCPIRRRRDEGSCGRPRLVQPVELVFTHRRLRAHARRLVAEQRIQGSAARHPVHGHR